LDLTIPNYLKRLSRNSLDEACRFKDIETLQGLNDSHISECPEQVDFQLAGIENARCEVYVYAGESCRLKTKLSTH